MKGYDYSLAGGYFITITTYRRICLFGDIVDGRILLNPCGVIAREQWVRLQKRFPPCDFSTFIIMPNHIHGIILIVRGAGEESLTTHVQIPPQRPYSDPNLPITILGNIIRSYKSSVAYRINAMRGFLSPPVWQRNYYDHIIRHERDYEAILKYIEANPVNWADDRLHPTLGINNTNYG